MPFGRSRKFPEHRNRPDRPPDQFARAVRANTLEDLIGAVSTEGAFKAADAGLNALRRKITVATLTIRLQLQHRLPSGASSRRTIVEVSGARETEAIIPSRSRRREPRPLGAHMYRERDRVERLFGRLKECRRVATRYEETARNYLASCQFASIRVRLA